MRAEEELVSEIDLLQLEKSGRTYKFEQFWKVYYTIKNTIMISLIKQIFIQKPHLEVLNDFKRKLAYYIST